MDGGEAHVVDGISQKSDELRGRGRRLRPDATEGEGGAPTHVAARMPQRRTQDGGRRSRGGTDGAEGVDGMPSDVGVAHESDEGGDGRARLRSDLAQGPGRLPSHVGAGVRERGEKRRHRGARGRAHACEHRGRPGSPARRRVGHDGDQGGQGRGRIRLDARQCVFARHRTSSAGSSSRAASWLPRRSRPGPRLPACARRPRARERSRHPARPSARAARARVRSEASEGPGPGRADGGVRVLQRAHEGGDHGRRARSRVAEGPRRGRPRGRIGIAEALERDAAPLRVRGLDGAPADRAERCPSSGVVPRREDSASASATRRAPDALRWS
jgi:hypothetical protein